MSGMGVVWGGSWWTSWREGGGALWLRGGIFLFLCFLHSRRSHKIGERERKDDFSLGLGETGGLVRGACSLKQVLKKRGNRRERVRWMMDIFLRFFVFLFQEEAGSL